MDAPGNVRQGLWVGAIAAVALVADEVMAGLAGSEVLGALAAGIVVAIVVAIVGVDV